MTSVKLRKPLRSNSSASPWVSSRKMAECVVSASVSDSSPAVHLDIANLSRFDDAAARFGIRKISQCRQHGVDRTCLCDMNDTSLTI